MVVALFDGKKSGFTLPLECDSVIFESVCHEEKQQLINLCEPYKIGDYLYVKEDFAHNKKGEIIYKANEQLNSKTHSDNTWKSARLMKKKDARIFLKIVEINDFKLKEIGIKEIFQEGCISSEQYQEYVNSKFNAELNEKKKLQFINKNHRLVQQYEGLYNQFNLDADLINNQIKEQWKIYWDSNVQTEKNPTVLNYRFLVHLILTH